MSTSAQELVDEAREESSYCLSREHVTCGLFMRFSISLRDPFRARFRVFYRFVHETVVCETVVCGGVKDEKEEGRFSEFKNKTPEPLSNL